MIATAEPIIDALKSYFARMGRKGGKTTGACKVRGDSEYYRKLGRKSATARRKAALSDGEREKLEAFKGSE